MKRVLLALLQSSFLACVLPSGIAQAQLKNSAWGIFDLVNGDYVVLYNGTYVHTMGPDGPEVGGKDLLQDPGWQNPHITGFHIRADWNSIQYAGPGTYDWSYLDYALGQCQLNAESNATKGTKLPTQISLLLVLVGKDGAPAWITGPNNQVGAAQFIFDTGPDQQYMPAPWDPVFQSYWQQFVSALGQRYDSSPYLSYVACNGASRSGEMFLCNNKADDAELMAVPGGVQTWINAAETIAGFYATAFPTTPLQWNSGNPFSSNDLIVNGVVTNFSYVEDYSAGISGQTSDRHEANYNPAGPSYKSKQVYAGPFSTFGPQFGLKGCSLTGGQPAPTQYDHHAIPYLSYRHLKHPACGFQMAHAFGSRTKLNDALSLGEHLNAQMIEVYSADVVRFPQDIERAQHALLAHKP